MYVAFTRTLCMQHLFVRSGEDIIYLTFTRTFYM